MPLLDFLRFEAYLLLSPAEAARRLQEAHWGTPKVRVVAPAVMTAPPTVIVATADAAASSGPTVGTESTQPLDPMEGLKDKRMCSECLVM